MTRRNINPWNPNIPTETLKQKETKFNKKVKKIVFLNLPTELQISFYLGLRKSVNSNLSKV